MRLTERRADRIFERKVAGTDARQTGDGPVWSIGRLSPVHGRFAVDHNRTLVEGAVATEDNLPMLRQVRDRSRLVVAFGECAVTGNFTALRDLAGAQ